MTDAQNPDARPQPYAAVPAPGRNVAGVAALVVGLVLVAIGLVQTVTGYFVPQLMVGSGATASQVGLVFGAVGIVTALLAIIGVVAGILGIQPSKTGGRLAAAAGLALSGAHLLSTLVGFVISAALSTLG